MISIIIASISPELISNLKKNIEKTIGCNYELLITHNKENPQSLCKIYNVSASKAKFPYLAFIHEDIIFHSDKWGKALVDILKSNEIGLVGIAGAVFKSSAPMSWIALPQSYYKSNAFFNSKEELHFKENKNDIIYDEVAVVDGMFLSMRKEVWQATPFNNELNSFHLYDIDISYRIKKNGYKIVIPRTIIIQHLSPGNFDLTWYNESLEWHKRKKLPIYLDNITKYEIQKLQAYSYLFHLNYLINNRINFKYWIPTYLKVMAFSKRMHLGMALKMVKAIFKKIFYKLSKSVMQLNKYILNQILKIRVKKKDFAIISNNCWGGEIYQALNVPYNTPFIGLFINSPCYIKLIKRFNYYMNCELKFIEKSIYPINNINYPIGRLDDIEIHFLHYKSKEEAYSKWARRTKRLFEKKYRLLFKFDDRDFSCEKDLYEFHKTINLNCISFSKNKLSIEKNVKLKKPNEMILLSTTFNLIDIALFLNKGIVKNTFINKIQNMFFIYPPIWTN